MASKITRRESREAPSDQESERGRHRCEWGRTAWTGNHELSPCTHSSDPSPLTHTFTLRRPDGASGEKTSSLNSKSKVKDWPGYLPVIIWVQVRLPAHSFCNPAFN